MSQRGAAAAPLRPVPLQDLRLLAAPRSWPVEQRIQGLETLTPVVGRIQAHHRGPVLEVEGEARTSLRLCCDRCLRSYRQELTIEARESIELIGAPGAPQENPEDILGAAMATPSGEDLAPLEGPLDDRLDPRGCFDPERWLFEQLSLRLPQVNRCGDDCPGPPRWGSDGDAGEDPRWAALRSLRPG